MARSDLSTQIVGSGELQRYILDGARLEVVRGPDKGAALPLEAHSLRIGKASECDLVLQDPTVSSHHAEVFPGREGYVMRDLGSTNLIKLGKWTVREFVLVDRMKIQLGETTLQVRATSEQTSLLLRPAGQLLELAAHSLPMRAMMTELEKMAPSQLPLLIEGETGSGKEMVARAIHALSDRPGELVVADLPSIPPSLFASELFGHERGAFTGAESARAGLFEEGEGGTIFLDEVGELSLELQPQLLRVIEGRKSRRVGGDKERAHDVRVIAATNRNLREEVRRGAFREDLYFRLAGGRLRVPPLRSRPEDIPILARLFAEEAGSTLSAEVVKMLVGYNWPGNVRELRNAIERMAAMPEASFFELTDEADASQISPLPEARKRAILAFEAEYLDKVLHAAGDHIPEAARLAGVSHSMLSRMVRRHRRPERD